MEKFLRNIFLEEYGCGGKPKVKVENVSRHKFISTEFTEIDVRRMLCFQAIWVFFFDSVCECGLDGKTINFDCAWPSFIFPNFLMLNAESIKQKFDGTTRNVLYIRKMLISVFWLCGKCPLIRKIGNFCHTP